MVRTESAFVLNVGDQGPDFSLLEPATGKTVSLKEATLEHGILISFMCNHCPFVQWLAEELKTLGTDLPKKGVGMVGISSTDARSYPDDSPEEMKLAAKSIYSTFPYLYDETQEVAKAYGASCTPDFFLLDKDGKVYYRGQLDSSRPGRPAAISGSDVRQAVELMITGQNPPEVQKRSLGCSIKWKPGNEPDYA